MFGNPKGIVAGDPRRLPAGGPDRTFVTDWDATVEYLNTIGGWQWAVVGGVPAAIVALYFLKLKRQPLQVPSTFLWRKSIEDLHVNSLWQRLRTSILLLLQLLVVAAVVLAILRPVTNVADVGKHLILVVDASASMSATDVAPTRLAVAKQKAIAVVRQMKRGDAALVIACSDSARVVVPYTHNASEVERAIESIQPTARKTDVREALVIAGGLANPQRSGEDDAEAIPADLYLFSDGRFPNVDSQSLGQLSLKFVRIGESGGNVGLMTLEARRGEQDPDRLEIFARAHNFGAEPASRDAELAIDGVVQQTKEIAIAAGADEPLAFRVVGGDPSTVRIRLTPGDVFPLDDQAWTVIEPPRRSRVLVVGESNDVLRAALETRQLRDWCEVSYDSPDFLKDPQSDESDFLRRTAPFDLVVFDRWEPRWMPACNTYFIDALPVALADAVRTPIELRLVLFWNAAHPILRFLRLDDVLVYEGFTVPTPRGASLLVESSHGPVLFTLSRGVYTDLVQTFALIDHGADAAVYAKTDWPKRASFPLFIMNVVRTLGGVESEGRQAINVGEPATLRFPQGATAAQITFPSGRRQSIRASATGTFDFLDTEELGVYDIAVGDDRRQLAVNLFDETESTIAPAAEVRVGAVSEPDTSALVVSRFELWKIFAGAAVAILLLEWYVYNRRVYL